MVRYEPKKYFIMANHRMVDTYRRYVHFKDNISAVLIDLAVR